MGGVGTTKYDLKDKKMMVLLTSRRYRDCQNCLDDIKGIRWLEKDDRRYHAVGVYEEEKPLAEITE
jgi:hypothetical protein